MSTEIADIAEARVKKGITPLLSNVQEAVYNFTPWGRGSRLGDLLVGAIREGLAALITQFEVPNTKMIAYSSFDADVFDNMFYITLYDKRGADWYGKAATLTTEISYGVVPIDAFKKMYHRKNSVVKETPDDFVNEFMSDEYAGKILGISQTNFTKAFASFLIKQGLAYHTDYLPKEGSARVYTATFLDRESRAVINITLDIAATLKLQELLIHHELNGTE